jgi:replicative DNA helicase
MNEDYLSKPLPSNNDAERIVLGAILLDPKLIDIAKAHLVPSDFYNPIYKRIYAAMITVNENGDEIDAVAIQEVWKKNKDEAGEESLTWATLLVHGLPFIREKEFEKDCVVIKRHSVARYLLTMTTAVQRDILEGDDEIDDISKRVEQALLRVNDQLVGGTNNERVFVSMAEVVDPMAHQFASYNRGEFTGVRSGMKELDEKLDGGGFQPNATYLIGGAEKTGKTALALGWAYDVAKIQKKQVLYVTLEMSAVTMGKRLYSIESGIPFWKFRPGFNGSDYEQAIEGLEEFSKLPIQIADKLFGLAQIKHYLRREVDLGHKPKHIEVGMAVIDYLQLIGQGQASLQRTREVEIISRELKQLSAELGIPIIIMSSLNREGLKEGQEPDTFNLRDAQTLAFDAESVMFLHNPAYVPGKPYEPRDITDINLIISRQRNGPPGRIKLKLIGKYMQFMTEAQYQKHFGDPSADIPEAKSTGQLLNETKSLENNWDDEDW